MGTLVVERDTVGDTTFVRIVSGSVWDGRIQATEELAIGDFEGPDEYTFGMILEMTPDEAGALYLFDGQVPALRYYDPEGDFVRTLGGEGEGPGEYHDAALGLAIRSDGRLLMRDPRNARINVYEPDGSYSDAWPVASGLFTNDAMTVDTADHVYLKILMGRPQENEPWPVGLLHLDETGAILDTIPPPAIEGEPTDAPNGMFLPRKQWAMTRLGQIVIGVSDDYRFEIRNPDGSVIRVEKAWTAVELGPEEKAEWQALLDWRWEEQGQFMTAPMRPVPDRKPAYGDISAGIDGTIWIRLHVPAEKREPTSERGPEDPPPITWVEPRVYDVYESDATYLGQVQVPSRTNVMVFSRSHLWGVRRGDFDEQYAVRLGVEGGREMLETARSGGGSP